MLVCCLYFYSKICSHCSLNNRVGSLLERSSSFKNCLFFLRVVYLVLNETRRNFAASFWHCMTGLQQCEKLETYLRIFCAFFIKQILIYLFVYQGFVRALMLFILDR